MTKRKTTVDMASLNRTVQRSAEELEEIEKPSLDLLKGRTIHRSLVVSPAMEATLKAISELDGVSTSEIINRALVDWIGNYKPSDPAEFEEERERILARIRNKGKRK